MPSFDRWLRAHARAAMAAGGLIALLAGVGIGVLIGGTGTSSSGSTPTAVAPSTLPSTPATLAPRGAGNAAASFQRVRGDITRISGSNWTVTDRDGTSVEVQIGPRTLLGTRRAPLPLSSFVVGDGVVVAGQLSGGTLQASHVAMVRALAVPPTTTTAP